MFVINDIEIKPENDKQLVKKFIEENHYSHKIPQAIKYRFGFYYKSELCGVAIFSVPANMYSITSIFKNEPQNIGIELSRVFTKDYLPKNFESYCLSRCFKHIKNNSTYDVIISYADPNFGHIGYLYQALNGIYLGQTQPEVRYIYNGKLITRRGLGRKSNDSESKHAKRIIEDGAVKVKMLGKHKYLFFVCDNRRKKKLLKKMKVIISNYPKGG